MWPDVEIKSSLDSSYFKNFVLKKAQYVTHYLGLFGKNYYYHDFKKYLSLQEAFLPVGNWFTFHEQESHQESLHAN